MSAVKFGVTYFPTDYAIPPADLGRECEARGFESLWVAEHTHIPASRESPWPGGADLPQEYWHTLDPFVALTAAAMVTTGLRVGTGIALVIQRDPIVLAKEVASLDHISGGRFLFGVGGGWNREEMRDHGTDPALRWGVLRERIEAMKEIWTKDDAEYHGRYVDFGPMWSWPKPVQKPYPPILVGGDGPNTFKRVVAYGDAWSPIVGRSSATPFEDRLAEFRRYCEDHGRPGIPVTVYFVGRLDEEQLRRFAGLGVERLICYVPPAGADQVIPRLDRYAELLAKL
jgi:probable F420-dependent oxidoreductase